MIKIKVTNFAKRHFGKSIGTQIRSHTPKDIDELVSKIFNNLSNICKDKEKTSFGSNIGYGHTNWKILDGYADFCKLLIVENFTSARTGTAEITNENYQWLRSSYVSRRDSELPVLTRHLHLPVQSEKARYIVFVLYTNEHLIEEHKVNSNNEDLYVNEGEADFGIVSIMGQNVCREEPMTPATMIRNHLGKEFGGSGSVLDNEAYMRSVEFWSTHALIK